MSFLVVDVSLEVAVSVERQASVSGVFR